MTAGMRPARRVRRAAPLPNSVRVDADRRTSDTVVAPYRRMRANASSHLRYRRQAHRAPTRVTLRRCATQCDTASMTDQPTDLPGRASLAGATGTAYRALAVRHAP